MCACKLPYPCSLEKKGGDVIFPRAFILFGPNHKQTKRKRLEMKSKTEIYNVKGVGGGMKRKSSEKGWEGKR